MTVTELRKELERFESKGHGNLTVYVGRKVAETFVYGQTDSGNFRGVTSRDADVDALKIRGE